jgi:hypothetical protein
MRIWQFFGGLCNSELCHFGRSNAHLEVKAHRLYGFQQGFTLLLILERGLP